MSSPTASTPVPHAGANYAGRPAMVPSRGPVAHLRSSRRIPHRPGKDAGKGVRRCEVRPCPRPPSVAPLPAGSPALAFGCDAQSWPVRTAFGVAEGLPHRPGNNAAMGAKGRNNRPRPSPGPLTPMAGAEVFARSPNRRPPLYVGMGGKEWSTPSPVASFVVPLRWRLLALRHSTNTG